MKPETLKEIQEGLREYNQYYSLDYKTGDIIISTDLIDSIPILGKLLLKIDELGFHDNTFSMNYEYGYYDVIENLHILIYSKNKYRK